MDSVFIVESHFDDAAISMGGFLASLSNIEIHVITVFSLDETINPNIPNREGQRSEQKSVRRKEGLTYCKEIGAIHHFLDFEGPKDQAGLDTISVKLDSILGEGDLVFFPAAFGDHPEHVFVKNLAARYPFHLLYEDLSPTPYYAELMTNFWARYDTLTASYIPYYHDIEKVIDRKVELASIYASQFLRSQYKNLKHMAYATAIGAKFLNSVRSFEATYCERFYIPFKRYGQVVHRVRALLSSGGRYKSECSETQSLLHGDDSAIENLGLKRAFAKRRTNRALNGSILPFETLSSLLKNAGGVVSTLKIQNQSYLQYSYPTAGALGSTRISLICWHAEGLSPSVYGFSSEMNRLDPLNASPPDIIQVYNEMSQEWVLGASVCFLVEIDPTSIYEKYGFQAEKILLLEAGHLLQNFQLTAGALNLPHFISGFIPASIKRISSTKNVVGLCFVSGNGAAPVNEGLHRSTTLIPLPTRNKVLELAGQDICIARCEIPIANIVTTGIAKQEELAEIKAKAEANEILQSILIGPKAIQKRTLPLNGVPPHDILSDPLQLSRGFYHEAYFDESTAYYWIGGQDLFDGSDIAVLTDFVTLSKRYHNAIQIATTCGMAAGERIEDVRERALAELIEKVFTNHFSLNWHIVHHDLIDRFIDRVSDILKPEHFAFRETAFHDFVIFRCFYKDQLLASACGYQKRGALWKCLEEAFSKIAYGISAASFEHYVKTPRLVWNDEKPDNLIDKLRAHDLSVGLFQIEAMPSYQIDGEFQTIKLIAYAKV